MELQQPEVYVDYKMYIVVCSAPRRFYVDYKMYIVVCSAPRRFLASMSKDSAPIYFGFVIILWHSRKIKLYTLIDIVC